MYMNLIRLIEDFGSEEQCRVFLEKLRWPDGIRCPRCTSDKISRIKVRNQFDCDNCRYQFSVRVGSVFHDSHLPLWKWFLATYMICESKKGISALQLKRTLRVAYKTAWYLSHRIRSAMADVQKLSGVLEMDETYIGGKRRGAKSGRPGRTSNKVPVIGIIERGGKVNAIAVPDLTKATVEAVAQRFMSQNVEVVYTDENGTYHVVSNKHPHKRVMHNLTYVDGDVHTQGVENFWSLLKRGYDGTFHKMSAKHLPRYLDEFTFRFNNRKNDRLFQLTIQGLLTSPVLPFYDLVNDGDAS